MSAEGSAPGFSLAGGGPLGRLTLAGAAWGTPRGAMLIGLAAWLPLLAASIVLSSIIAFLEVYLFAFLGDLVDLLSAEDRATFWDTHGVKLMVMSVDNRIERWTASSIQPMPSLA